jgi:hypothetical protein
MEPTGIEPVTSCLQSAAGASGTGRLRVAAGRAGLLAFPLRVSVDRIRAREASIKLHAGQRVGVNARTRHNQPGRRSALPRGGVWRAVLVGRVVFRPVEEPGLVPIIDLGQELSRPRLALRSEREATRSPLAWQPFLLLRIDEVDAMRSQQACGLGPTHLGCPSSSDGGHPAPASPGLSRAASASCR